MNFAAAQDGEGPAAYARSAPDNFRPRAFETRDRSREQGDWNEEVFAGGHRGCLGHRIRAGGRPRGALYQSADDGDGLQLDRLLRRRQCRRSMGQRRSRQLDRGCSLRLFRGHQCHCDCCGRRPARQQLQRHGRSSPPATTGRSTTPCSASKATSTISASRAARPGSALYPCCAPTGFTVSSSVSADWLATIRGRIGFLAAPTWLLYATGGAAIAEVKGNFNFTDTFAAATEFGRDPRHARRLDRRCGHRICLRRWLVAQGRISLCRSRTQQRDQHQSASAARSRPTSSPTRSISNRTSCASA